MATNSRRRFLPASAASSSITRLQPFQEETFTYIFDVYSNYAQEEFGGIIPFCIRQIKRLLKFLVILFLSLISYHLFYTLAMPSFSVSAPIHFDYTGAPAPSFAPKFETCGEPENSLPTPWGSIDLFAKHQWDMIHTDDVVPAPLTSRRLLVSNRPYFMELILVLPESDINRASTGMFGVKVELASHNGTALAVSRRSARFPHQSRWISTLQKAAWLVPLILGAMEESKHVVVSVFRHYVESRDHPLRHIHVRILPQQSASALVEVTKAEIRMGKEFNMLQNVLRDWYFTCYTIGTLVFMVLYASICMIAEALLEGRRRELQSESDVDINTEGDMASDDTSSRASADGAETPRRSEFLGTEYSQNHGQENDWDDIFYDAPIADGPDDSGS